MLLLPWQVRCLPLITNMAVPAWINQNRQNKYFLLFSFFCTNVGRFLEEISCMRVVEKYTCIRQEKTTRETSQAAERRPGQILEGHDLAEDCTRQANLEAAC